MKEIERIIKLEVELLNAQKDIEELKTTIRKLKVDSYELRKRLWFFLWLGKSWKNVLYFALISGVYFCFVDMMFSTEKFHAWFMQTVIPWAVNRVLD